MAWCSPVPLSMSVVKATMPRACSADTALSMAPGQAVTLSAQVRAKPLGSVANGSSDHPAPPCRVSCQWESGENDYSGTVRMPLYVERILLSSNHGAKCFPSHVHTARISPQPYDVSVQTYSLRIIVYKKGEPSARCACGHAPGWCEQGHSSCEPHCLYMTAEVHRG